MNDFKILDCTLRDGGYYNHWDFEPNIVSNYLNAMSTSKVDYVELGLRNFPQQGFRGAFAYTTEEFLNRIELPPGPKYGVMVDAKTILSAELSTEEAINKLFVDKRKSKVSLVRIAAHFHEVEYSRDIVKLLKAKGYIVGLNLMQAGGKASETLSQRAKLISSWNDLDVLYFADSLGNMDRNEVLRIVNALREEWTGDLGIHTHNNMDKALDNCLTAKSNGVKWLDATVTGMGRGAGNAQLENLLATVAGETQRYTPSSVFELAIRYFEPMRKECGWGSNLLYFLGAQNNLHPTYIQNLLSDTHFGVDEIIGAISYLSKQENKSSYNGDVYRAALSFSGNEKSISGTSELCGIANGKEVLVIANGPSLKRYLEDVKAYIADRKPVVIAINVNEELAKYIDYYCVSHNNKFLSDSDAYKTLTSPVILPKHRFSDSELELFSKNNSLIDYGLEVQSDSFSALEKSCVVPFDITVAYAFAVVEVMKASKLTLIGFDGYDSHDARQIEMLKLFSMMEKFNINRNLFAITPTTYPVPQESLYAPFL